MENIEINKLREEIELLKSQVADLKSAQDKDFDELSKLIKEVYTNAYQYIADIYDFLWPVVHKLFPEYASNKKQIDAIIKRPGPGAAQEKKA